MTSQVPHQEGAKLKAGQGACWLPLLKHAHCRRGVALLLGSRDPPVSEAVSSSQWHSPVTMSGGCVYASSTRDGAQGPARAPPLGHTQVLAFFFLMCRCCLETVSHGAQQKQGPEAPGHGVLHRDKDTRNAAIVEGVASVQGDHLVPPPTLEKILPTCLDLGVLGRASLQAVTRSLRPLVPPAWMPAGFWGRTQAGVVGLPWTGSVTCGSQSRNGKLQFPHCRAGHSSSHCHRVTASA